MRIKTLVALYFWILEFDDVTCIRSIANMRFAEYDHMVQNPPCWNANCAQRRYKLEQLKSLCFGRPSAYVCVPVWRILYHMIVFCKRPIDSLGRGSWMDDSAECVLARWYVHRNLTLPRTLSHPVSHYTRFWLLLLQIRGRAGPTVIHQRS